MQEVFVEAMEVLNIPHQGAVDIEFRSHGKMTDHPH